jgi:polysaccharide biosynthesis/export protein
MCAHTPNHYLIMKTMIPTANRPAKATARILVATLWVFLSTVVPTRAANEIGRFADPPKSPLITNSTVATSMETLDDKHLLAAGDKLSFRIVEDNEDPKSLLVNDNGELEVPYIGRFPVSGKTCRKAAREIKAELEKDFYHQATVIIAVDLLTKTLGKIYLVGSVRTPGPQEIPSDEVFTISKAVMRAGGFGEFGDKNHVKITRRNPGKSDGTSQVIVVRVGDILEKGRMELDVTLEPGDLIFVPNRLVSF